MATRCPQRLRGVLVLSISTLCVAIAAVPALATPDNTVPDTGSRPTAVGAMRYPDTAVPGAPTGATQSPAFGPLATQITEERRTVALAGEQLKLTEDHAKATEGAVRAAQVRLSEAERVEAEMKQKANSVASDAFKQATALGPLAELAPELRDFSIIAPGLEDQPGGEALARALLRAQRETKDAWEAYNSATAAANDAQSKWGNQKLLFDQKTTALSTLIARNSAMVAEIDAAKEIYEQGLGGASLGEINADGMTADPKALRAVSFALSQLHDPYQWGAEGPDRYDCSGLMLAAYRSVGVSLPRVARDQYLHGPTVQASRSVRGDLLVPGDLVFFSTNPYSAEGIHHVGMYIGSGKMVHAPHTGDFVRISPVYWSEFFGAVRIFKEVPAPKTGPSTTPPSTTPPKTVPPSNPSSQGGSGGSTTPPPSEPKPSMPSKPGATTKPTAAPPSPASSGSARSSGSTTLDPYASVLSSRS